MPASHEAPPALATDSERPVVRSVEPAAAAAAAAPVAAVPAATPPVAVEPREPAPLASPPVVAPTGPTIGGRLGAQLANGVELLRGRTWLVTAGVIAGAGLLLGLAIGHAVAHRNPLATAAESDHGLHTSAVSGSCAAGVRESVSAGGIAPGPGAARRSVTRAPSRPATGGAAAPRSARRPAGRTPTPRQGSPLPAAAAAATPAPSPAPETAPATAPVGATPDSAAIRARRDSLARAASL